ncbi:NAC domain-domain-containing protein [Leucosporidium creatinivorum]|uniref:Nascent polypeptide-associated complex subunit beta n=1 Tax=Leucosporidium creatinivorum TaxID=106004 RepID=A0A1Y2EU03_9BASI|nr:NAC domain-domain-containing protein [Leucosporidium creatinivorum]
MSSQFDPEALKKLQAKTAGLRIGGKGTQRKKVVAKARPGAVVEDKKLQAALKKLELSALTGVEEVNMFYENTNVLHFTAPKVHAATGANTFAIYGRGEEKELTELVPGILSQLGPEAMNGLRRIAESYQAQQGSAGSLGPDGVPAVAAEDDDDEVPELVEADATPKIDEVN